MWQARQSEASAHNVSILQAYADKYLSFFCNLTRIRTQADDDMDHIDHGTMFYKAKNGLIDPKRSIQVGIRTTNEDPLDISMRPKYMKWGHGLRSKKSKVSWVI